MHVTVAVKRRLNKQNSVSGKHKAEKNPNKAGFLEYKLGMKFLNVF